MQNSWIEKWDERYAQSDFAYGTHPNVFLKEQLSKWSPGTILFPAEGEGRNAVFAAQQGWTVSAFDVSIEGKKKAMQWAKQKQVSIQYEVGLLPDLDYQPSSFDAMALIYAHFPASMKASYHHLLSTYLRTGGVLIFEAFSKKHLDYRRANPAVGGPDQLDMLFSIEEIQEDFKEYEFLELEEKEIELKEGLYHNGKGSVIRMVGKKK